ncbi:hypothetical protein GCM10011608_52320 [Micromonospora sonchi]|uniref:Uncharacterized protein n=1 Tax=Micromonospora sonchi TaxID=1763543 RepID=A0A917U7A0_9ACTN|nr:hypothetical protein GCM10011608_52320 [Micromonospora sonchi]
MSRAGEQGQGAAQIRHSQSGRSGRWDCDVICVPLLRVCRLEAGPSVADVPDGPASVAPVLFGADPGGSDVHSVVTRRLLSEGIRSPCAVGTGTGEGREKRGMRW